jgi:hypothetical protein
MNWAAGALAFVLFLPAYYILYRMHKKNNEIDAEYKKRLN